MVRAAKLALGFCLALLFFGMGARDALAQAPPGPLPPKPGAPVQQPPAPQPKPEIRVRVSLVSAPVTVRDAAGELVLSLAANDFRIFDNGIAQRIEHFDLGGDPLSLVFVFETSSRIEALLPAVRKSVILFTQTVMGHSGEAAVLGFNDTADLLVPFTSDADTIEKAIARLPEGTSGARLYDTLSRAVQMLSNKPPQRRRVIVVVSEAVDTGSETKLGEALRDAQLANITIYTVGLSTTAAELRGPPKQTGPTPPTPPGTFGLPPMPGTPQTPTSEQQRYGNIDLMALAVWIVQHATEQVHAHALEVATTATGGMHLAAFRDRSIEKALDQIAGELHAQYTLGYRPAGSDPVGYHEIKVQVSRRGLKVRARPGYYIAPPET